MFVDRIDSYLFKISAANKKRFLLFLLLFVGFLTLINSVYANENQNHSNGYWSGAWGDGEGGFISVKNDGRFLNVVGKDDYSVYHAACLLSEDFKSAECQGQGVQIKSGHRFLLRSRWVMMAGEINETWTAYLEEKKLTGKLVFNRVAGS